MPKQQRLPMGAQANSYTDNCSDVRVGLGHDFAGRRRIAAQASLLALPRLCDTRLSP